MNITIIGTGYVGLVTGTCFSETGNNVICVDNNLEKLSSLQKGKLTIFEPGLEILLHRNIKEGRLHFTSDLATAVESSEIIMLALPTPQGGDGKADLSYIMDVTSEISKIIKEYKIIVTKSTVPVGTAEKITKAIREITSVEVDVVSNPEFLREGFAVENFMKPDRIIIGASSQRAKEVMDELYGPYVRQGNPIFYMDTTSAELSKYAANAFLATKISFMNEIANMCEKVGADVDLVRKGIGADDRIGKRFLFPGIGYGGSCFPKDVMALFHSAKENDYNFQILTSVINVNEKQKHFLIPKILKHFKQDIKNKKMAIWGLAFKPNTDDIREAPALTVIQDLLQAGVSVSVFDPIAMNNVRNLYGDKIRFGIDQYEVLTNVDALIIVTEWPEFRTPDFKRMFSLMKNKVIFDGRNVFDLNHIKKLNCNYYSVGRKDIE